MSGSLDSLSHEGDALHAGGLGGSQDPRHAFVFGRGIGGDAQLRQVAGMFTGLCLQARLQIADGHRLAIPAQLVRGIQAQLDRRGRFGAIDHAIGGLWQLHGNRPGHDRRGHDEDDQEHQHHIHQWRDVDVRQRAASSCATERHVPLPAAGPFAQGRRYDACNPVRQGLRGFIQLSLPTPGVHAMRN